MSRLGASQIEITGGFAALASCGGSFTKKVTSGTTIPPATQALILIPVLTSDGSDSESYAKQKEKKKNIHMRMHQASMY